MSIYVFLMIITNNFHLEFANPQYSIDLNSSVSI